MGLSERPGFSLPPDVSRGEDIKPRGQKLGLVHHHIRIYPTVRDTLAAWPVRFMQELGSLSIQSNEKDEVGSQHQTGEYVPCHGLDWL